MKRVEREIIKTEDGSHTLYVKELDETYHSNHGAIQESEHIFINNGLKVINKNSISVFEVGFGTGLNALLTLDYAIRCNKNIYYESYEKYPLEATEYEQLNFAEQINTNLCSSFIKTHNSEWGQRCEVHNNFIIKKIKLDIRFFEPESQKFDVIYFDAFSPDKQPDLWDLAVFEKMFNILNTGGVLVTYSAKGQVRRNMQSVGFTVERLAGPIGKREILRGVRKVKS